MSEYSILLVEDDESLGFVIEDNLKHNGYRVEWCKDGESGLKCFNENQFNLCLVDVMMPRKDGFSLAEDIRRYDRNVPILFLTAKSMQEDKIKGFELGGDDYITKPFSMQELLYRMEVFLRRSSANIVDRIKLGKYSFNYTELDLSCDSFAKHLTQKEADVLKFLCDNRGKVVKREDILKSVWGEDDYFLGRSMDVFISKLRKYLKEDPTIKIENYHGVGFKLIG